MWDTLYAYLHRAESDPHVRDCITCYTADYMVVNRHYEAYSSQHLDQETERRDSRLEVALRQEYEVDVEEDVPSDVEKVGAGKIGRNLSKKTTYLWCGLKWKVVCHER